MKKSRRFSAAAPVEGEARSNQRARKKGHSVLIQRAVLFTAAVFLVAVIIGSPVYHLANRLGAGRWASTIGLIAGFIAACGMSLPLSRWILMKSVQEISKLRDVAVKVAGGDFDAHADETVPDEMGQMGTSLNNLSYHLSRNV